VGDKKLPVTINLYIADEEGNRISNENIVIADSRSENHAERMFREKFVLKDKEYDRNKMYHLVVKDDGENITPILQRIPVTIDLLISSIDF